ncbi:hypothetical protein FRC08_012498, partial [Ceratobasidium sp. 394]
MSSQTTLVSSAEMETGEGNSDGVETALILLDRATNEAAPTQERWLEVEDRVALDTKDELASELLQQGQILEAQRLYLSAWDLRKR